MAFWSGEKLEEELPKLIEPFDPKAIDCAAYTLHVGDEIYVSPDREVSDPTRHTKKRLSDGAGFTIPPGQFAFLSTREVVTVPAKALAFISIKARLKFSGLINISGFHVDPGYSGKLLFSVLNAGPKPLHLTQGQPLFLVWYADLDQATEKKKTDPGFTGIDPALIVSVRCAPPNGADFDGLVSTIDSGHLGALYGCEAEEAALAGICRSSSTRSGSAYASSICLMKTFWPP